MLSTVPMAHHPMNMPAGMPTTETITTRFGEVTVQTNNAILFPGGLLGMPDKYHFTLAEFPNKKFSQFMLLQSLDDHALSFITLPAEMKNSIVAAEDIAAACRDLEIEPRNLALLFIVSVQRTPERVTLSVNARAPIFIDSARRAAMQYVFPNDKYQVRHIIGA